MKLGATLVQATNLIILLANNNSDMRKFIIWRKDEENLTEVLTGLQITRIAIEDNAKLFEHPIETGAVITDHEIFDPNRGVIQAYISNDDAETLTELMQLYKSGTPLKIRAGNQIIPKALIASKPFEINGAVFDKTLYSIAFKEYYEVTPTYSKMPPRKVRNKANASRVNKGVKQGQTRSQSWFHNLAHGRNR